MKQINCQIETCYYRNFQVLYPQFLSRFVRNCIRYAVENRQFFQDIVFKYSEVKK